MHTLLRRKVYLFLLLGGATRPALAQWLLAPGPLRVSVGLQAAWYPQLARLADPGRARFELARPWPAQFMVSVARERRSLELGLLLRADPATESSYSDADGTTTTRATGQAWAVPIVNRWQLAPQRPQPWRLDLALGMLVTHSSYELTSTYLDSHTGVTSPLGGTSDTATDLPVLAGVGAAYQLTPHFSLTADARLSWSWLTGLVAATFNGRSTPLEPACGLGVAYTFNPAAGAP